MIRISLEIKSEKLGKKTIYNVAAYEQKGLSQSCIGLFSGTLDEIKQKIIEKTGDPDLILERSSFEGWY